MTSCAAMGIARKNCTSAKVMASMAAAWAAPRHVGCSDYVSLSNSVLMAGVGR
jgi:hypothetical protein